MKIQHLLVVPIPHVCKHIIPRALELHNTCIYNKVTIRHFYFAGRQSYFHQWSFAYFKQQRSTSSIWTTREFTPRKVTNSSYKRAFTWQYQCTRHEFYVQLVHVYGYGSDVIKVGNHKPFSANASSCKHFSRKKWKSVTLLTEIGCSRL